MSVKAINTEIPENMNMPILYITIGIPGSGKTTWVKNNLSKSCKVIALDNIRREVYGFFSSGIG